MADIFGFSADPLTIAGKAYQSRLLLGTGKYRTSDEAREAIAQSGAEIVTMALRRMDLTPGAERIDRVIDPAHYTYLPNSAGCYTAEEAVRLLRLAREAGNGHLVKLEVIGNKKTLYPDMIETMKAAEILVNDGFDVMAYCSDDPLLALRLEEIGCAAVMPLAAPIGSGLGLLNPLNLRLIIEQSGIPVIIDAGLGAPSDAALAMELGADGVLLNTAVAEAGDPPMMARAFRQAVIAGRLGFLARRMAKRPIASASSPDEGRLTVY